MMHKKAASGRFYTWPLEDIGITGTKAFITARISRTEWQADLHIAGQVQVFAQFESDFAPWKTTLTPADQDVLE